MNRYLPAFAFLAVAAVGTAMTIVVFRAEDASTRLHFERIADKTVERIDDRISRYLTLLQATNAFFTARDGAVSKTEMREFVTALDLKNRFGGILGLGLARLINAGDEAPIEAELSERYGGPRPVWPETKVARRTPIVLLEPFDRANEAALGYDMFSEPVRRAAMQQALATGEGAASGPVDLVQEITGEKQGGFLYYLPFPDQLTMSHRAPSSAPPTVEGFIYAPFVAADLHREALVGAANLPLVIETRDVTDGGDTVLFQSSDFTAVTATSAFTVNLELNVAGRIWSITAHETEEFLDPSRYWRTGLLAFSTMLLAIAAAVLVRLQLKAIRTAHEMQAMTEKTVEDKNLLLQETKHRIKNSIARILAMARQTAINSNNLEEFSASFESRMQAMANAQDMLTESSWRRAPLRDLLQAELNQVFGDRIPEEALDGPNVEFGETAAQALGLTFHELATNAMKYGGLAEQDGTLSVAWRHEDDGDHLAIDWVERRPSGSSITDTASEVDANADNGGSAPSSGFGTRLIDASIRLELNGTIERSFGTSETRISISIPLNSTGDEVDQP
ncbi:CHASE domain-containing protein [Nisaea sp.]|uniref:CHASE domain-containing protein n=1 Tax=Nisaea sp. TaxID=2024842 RepID=UPI003264C300